MFKNIFFASLTLMALGMSSALQAADQPAAEDTPVQATPSDTANTAPVEGTQPVAGTVSALQAASTRPNNDKLVDYRYCLELKSDREIAECRYKK